jgi:hypothetical protein
MSQGRACPICRSVLRPPALLLLPAGGYVIGSKCQGGCHIRLSRESWSAWDLALQALQARAWTEELDA